VFNDLDTTLRAVLDDSAAPAALRGAEVSFETPEKDFTPAQPLVNLFLYEVQENHQLRENGPIVDLVDGRYASGPPPVRIDCTYLVTAWSTKSGALKTEEEHRLLGLALLWLNRFPVIGAGFLQGDLANPAQPFPLPTMVAQLKEDQSSGQFWTALGIAPRPAFSLTVTISMQLPEEPDEFPVVQGIRLESASLLGPALGGRVLDATLAPVAGAKVTVVETGDNSTGGPDAAFSFAGIAFGEYTLLVEVAGRPEVRAPVGYAADNQVHNVILPGP
jgi:hypothetical protein